MQLEVFTIDDFAVELRAKDVKEARTMLHLEQRVKDVGNGVSMPFQTVGVLFTARMKEYVLRYFHSFGEYPVSQEPENLKKISEEMEKNIEDSKKVLTAAKIEVKDGVWLP